MSVVTHEDVRRRTGDLGQKIVASLWPHDEALAAPVMRIFNNDGTLPPLGTLGRAAVITTTADVDVDDIVLISDQRRRVHEFQVFRYFTAREAVAHWSTVMARVIAKTAHMITVVEFPLPTGYWASLDLTCFGEPQPDTKSRTMRMGLDGRQIAHLGTLKDLRHRIASHADFSNWQTAYAASARVQQIAEEERRNHWQAEKERQVPLRAAAECLQKTVGSDLAHWGHWVGGVVVAEALREPGRLRTYVAGLRSTETIDDEEYAVAQQQLDLLSL